MNILFLTLVNLTSLDGKSIYEDLLREFIRNGHYITVISPQSNHNSENTIIELGNAKIIKVQIGNIWSANKFIKGLNTIRIESKYIQSIKAYLAHERFDLVLYSTPPITLCKAVSFVKKRDHAETYLMLKDIFPQNAVDIGLLSKKGCRRLIYSYFRRKEKELYLLSNYIGCMSEANCEYLKLHNTYLDSSIVEVCPNISDVDDLSINNETKVQIRKKYGIPLDSKVFIYGGNLGKPQGIPFLVSCLKEQSFENAFFLIIGNGTEYATIEAFIKKTTLSNIRLYKRLPKTEYENLVSACDIGMIFLDHRFTIPNYPSRILSYMKAKLPVLAVTDVATDIGRTIEKGGFGWWCESDNVDNFIYTINRILSLPDSELKAMKENSFAYLKLNYSPKVAYKTIIKHLEKS